MNGAHRVMRAAGAIAVLGIALLGVLKLMDFPGFAAAVRGWSIFPRWAIGPVAVVTPVAEVAIAAWWLVADRRRRPEWAALALLVCFSAIYLFHWRTTSVTNCGCFGVLSRRFRDVETAKFVLGKNAVLGLMLLASLLSQWLSASRRQDRAESAVGPAQRRAGAFTLIETLLVIAVIGILIALTVPVLSRVRDSGRAAVTLSNLRSHGATFAAYHADYKDLYPVLTDPTATYSVIRCESAGVAVRAKYFQACEYWGLALADQYYNGVWTGRQFGSGWELGVDSPRAWLDWGCSFVADPTYYNRRTRRDPPAQLRPVRVSEVTFPASKSLMVAYVPWVRFKRILASMVDGRALEVRPSDIRAGHPTGDGNYPAYSFHFPGFTPMMHTADGVRGRDLAR